MTRELIAVTNTTVANTETMCEWLRNSQQLASLMTLDFQQFDDVSLMAASGIIVVTREF